MGVSFPASVLTYSSAKNWREEVPNEKDKELGLIYCSSNIPFLP